LLPDSVAAFDVQSPATRGRVSRGHGLSGWNAASARVGVLPARFRFPVSVFRRGFPRRVRVARCDPGI
jgi:hypothetical protein